eukprot:gene22022-28116_t
MVDYHGSKQGELPPHLFVVAEAAYSALVASREGKQAKNQSIIISGESGAGKTEATKVIMTFLTRITAIDTSSSHVLSPSPKTQHVDVGELEQRVLNTNPMLEAFGNAKTLRNDNSSRFGKFIKIQFNKTGRIVGATIEKYLLEKTRIIHQLDGERNYHIFYQLLRGASDSELEELSLTRSMADYVYLSSQDSASVTIANVSDEEEFQSTKRCMASIGIDEQMQTKIFRLLSGVLHIGNVEFDSRQVDCEGTNAEGSINTPETLQELATAANMLGFSTEDLLASMTVVVTKVGNKEDKMTKHMKVPQAREKRESFAKSVYSMIFSWLVDRINSTISPADPFATWGFIGLLDIYGFENFDQQNTFEQLLINYANEKMQSHFNKHIFEMEQKEYTAESIDWSYVEFSDNQPCVELIDSKIGSKSGIFQTLDDHSLSTSSAFLTTLNNSFSGSSGSENARHTNYVAPRFNSDQRFGVLHYAGEVFYEIEGFVEKNKESTNNEMKDLMTKSSNDLLRAMMEETLRQEMATSVANALGGAGVSGNNQKGKKGSASLPRSGSVNLGNGNTSTNKLKEDSISKQFTVSLKQLFETLETTQPHFVRCVKPNTYKQSDFMNASETLLQLKYAGMMETIRIRQQGYSLRMPLTVFFKQYVRLSPKSKIVTELVADISKQLKVSSESWQIGTSKIFMKREMGEKLGKLLALLLSGYARKIQRQWNHLLLRRAATKAQSLVRAFLHRRRFHLARKHITKLQTAYRGFRHAKAYKQQLKAVVHIQRVAYGRLARKLAKSLRNPYNRMTYQELTAALKKSEVDLKTAFEAKDFATCATLDGVIADIRTARAKLPLPDLIPANRKEVETYILEMMFAIEYYVELQDYSLVPSFQARLFKMESFRATFPTSEEVTVELAAAKATLATAMSKKEFKKCGELQEKVTCLEAQLVAIEKSTNGELMRRPLEDLRVMRDDFETRIAAAVEAKDFDLCDSIQSELDALLSVMVKRDLTREQADERRAAVHYEMKVSRETREFQRMAELQDDFDLLSTIIIAHDKRKVELEAAAAAAAAVEVVEVVMEVDPLVGKTYEELSADIESVDKEIELAVAAKEYKKCEELEETKLKLQTARSKLPVPEPTYTRVQLEALVAAKTVEIEAALQSKNYKLCDELNAESERLKAKLALMPTAAIVAAQIQSLNNELKELIATKQYARCADVEAKQAALQPLYEKLLAEEPKPEPKPQPVATKPVVVAKGPAIKVSGSAKPLAGSKVSVKASSDAASSKAPSVLKPVIAVKPVATKPKDERSVAKLRPKAPITASDSCNILEVAMKMAASRADAALLLDADGALSGIITDNDVTRRVVSQFVNPSDTGVKDVMTKGPKCVRSEDSALDALEMMVDNRFRHLPVLDQDGVVVGLLDIAKCLYDAISVLEKVHGDDSKENGSAGNNGAALANVMSTAMKSAAGGRGNNKAQMAAMQLLMEQMFGGSVPTLRTIIGDEELPFVRQTINVREASCLMAKFRKGLLVLDEDEELVGIITPKDVLMRVLAQNKSPDLTAVSSVMTPNPDCVSPDLTLIDALREMHDHKYLHLPVRDDNGTVVGLVDVMELVCSTAGGENGGKGWRDFFSGAMNARDDRSDTASHYSSVSTIVPIPKPVPIRAKYLEQRLDTSSDVFSVGFENKGAMSALTYSMHGDQSEFYAADFDFKVIDTHGHLHKVRSSAENIAALKVLVSEKVSIPVESLLLKYFDEEKDEVTLSSDASLKDAVEFARSAGHMALKLTAITVPVAVAASHSGGDKKSTVLAVVEKPPAATDNTMMLVGGGLGLVAVLGA